MYVYIEWNNLNVMYLNDEWKEFEEQKWKVRCWMEEEEQKCNRKKKWKKEKQNGKSKSEMLSPIQQNGRESKSEMLLC